MIRLGLRLLLGGGKEAAVRLVATTVAVALGVGLLLSALAGMNAVDAQNDRYDWLNTQAPSPASTTAEGASGSVDGAAPEPLWWLLEVDRFDGEYVGVLDVAATGPSSPVPPGISDLPGPGEFYASPALGELLRSTPADELGDRFPGRQVGTIGDAALPGPDSLVIIVGHRADELAQVPGAEQVTAIGTTGTGSCPECGYFGFNADAITVILAVVAGALLFPVLIFIGTATRLAAARREQRFAAMRLVGATPRQVAVISTVESTVVTAVGVIVAFGLFYLLRTPLASVPFTGEPFFPSDLSLGLVEILPVVLGVPATAAVASRVALRRVQISPLGVSRRVTPRAPRASRLIPLVVGIGELAVVVAIGRPDTTGAQILAYAPGFLLTMAGLLLAGPWLTMVGARRLARRTRRPAALIAGRRLQDNPKAGFRAISGLVLALFVASVAVGAITTFVAERGTPSSGPEASKILVARSEPEMSAAPRGDAVRASLQSTRGVDGVSVIHTNPLGPEDPLAWEEAAGDGRITDGLVACEELARTPALGRCEPGAEVAALPAYPHPEATTTVWPAADISPERLRSLPVESVAVGTDGSTAVTERARTVLGASYPDLDPPMTFRELDAEVSREMALWQQLANVVILTSLPIAGCSLAVSVAGGLIDRKRPFSLLRLTGVPLGVLRRVVALESAVPLLLVAALSTGTGFLTAHLFLRVQLDYSLRPPPVEYYVVVLAALAASLAVIASTLPLLTRLTGPETARNE